MHRPCAVRHKVDKVGAGAAGGWDWIVGVEKRSGTLGGRAPAAPGPITICAAAGPDNRTSARKDRMLLSRQLRNHRSYNDRRGARLQAEAVEVRRSYLRTSAAQ